MPNIIGGTDNTSTTETAGILSSTPNYNAIINGNFDFWQSAGTNPTIGGGSGTFYHADMWALAGQTAVPLVTYLLDISQIPTTTQSGFYGNTCYANVSNTPSYTAATWSSLYRYAMEGNDLAPLRDRVVTFNFWFRVSASAPVGAYSFSLYDPNNNRSYVTTFTTGAIGIWTPISITVPMTGFTSAADSSLALEIYIANFAGSSFTTSTTEAWQTGAFFNANTAVNPNVTNSHCRLSQVSMTAGNGVGAMGFQRNGRTIFEEQHSCYRYFETSYDTFVVPGAVSTTGGQVGVRSVGSSASGCGVFKAQKRAIPSVNIYSPNSGAINNVYDLNTAADVAGTAIDIGMSSFITSMPGGTAGDSVRFHFVADSRI